MKKEKENRNIHTHTHKDTILAQERKKKFSICIERVRWLNKKKTWLKERSKNKKKPNTKTKIY